MKYDKSYALEKASHSLRSLSSIAEEVSRSELNPSQQERLLFPLSIALWNITKALSCITETEWSINDPDLVLHKHEEGLQELLVKYGVMDGSQTNRYQRFAVAKRLLDLTRLDRGDARTLCHEVLLTAPKEQPFIKLAECLEEVTMCSRDWNQFRATAEGLLRSVVERDGRV